MVSTKMTNVGLARKHLKFKVRLLIEYAKSLYSSPQPLAHSVLIGTHHKSGCHWMIGLFRQLSRLCDYPFYAEALNETIPSEYAVVYHCDSRFDAAAWNDMPYRGLHLIRDPRDIIISGCFYHQKSDEAWLHIKRPEFGGMTYQEKLNSISAMRDKLLFEMENKALDTITEICQWDYQNPAFFEAKYEDLILDRDLLLFHEIFTFLGFEGEVIPKALNLAWKNSLFSNRIATSVHVRSGKPSQWKQYFEPCHQRRFIELFGDALVSLGYEKDNTWAEVPQVPTNE